MSRLFLPSLLLITACSTEEATPWIWTDLEVEAAPAFDPKLQDGSLEIVVRAPEGLPADCTTQVTAVHQNGLSTLITTLNQGSGEATATWDGRADDGEYLDPGQVQLVASMVCDQQNQGFGEAFTYIIRMGAGAVDLGVAGDAGQQPLGYHKTTLLDRFYHPIPRGIAEWVQRKPPGQLADLDFDDGEPRTGPGIWDAPDTPPWGASDPSDLSQYNAPVAYIAGSDYSVGFTPGYSATSARTGTAVPADGPLLGRSNLPILRVISDELTPASEGAWSPGRPSEFRSTTPLPNTLGRHDLSFTWRLEALDGREWVPVPGSFTTTHAVWVLAGPTAVKDGTGNGASPSMTWVGVLNDLQEVIQDLPADDVPAIMTALRLHLHDDPYLKYNPGDSAYSTFEGRYIYWSRIWMEMGDWIDRTDGIDLYCHSVACLLSSQANHLGINAEYLTITNASHPENGATFQTWLAMPAGGSDWRRYRFNSHGITSVDDVVWDAAVEFDGDSNPGETPVTPVTPAGVPLADYLQLLTPDEMAVVNSGKCENF